MVKNFTCNILKSNIKLEGTWWYSARRVTWTILNWSNCIYNRIFRKSTLKNPNYLGISSVSISQFHSGFGWDKHLKVWQEICDCKIRSSVFMKLHSRYCITFWRRGGHQSRLNHLECNIQKIFIMFWMEWFQEMIHFIIINFGHKADACIIRGPKLLPPSLRIKMNQFNALHGDEQKEPPREWNSQPPAAHFKSKSSPSRTNPLVSAIMGKLNHHSIDNGDITSDIPG